MCGISGIFNLDKTPIELSTLKKMTEIIEHRGPDGEGYWSDNFIGFGHRRLAIIDLSSAGHQPMMSRDGRYIIAYNGEIYNFRELRKELKELGYRFNSNTDCEVLLYSWCEWREDSLLRFNGMFAFAIWDNRDQSLFLARDRCGIKPLYYWPGKNKVVFASEIKSIIQHPEFVTNVSISALHEYFSFQNIFSDLTLFEGVYILPAGHFFEFKPGKGLTGKTQYWDFNFKEDRMFSDEDEYIEELNRLFQQAVNRQLVSDVEIGSYLSGGMDSGGITAVAAKNFKDLKTFTGGFDLSSASGLELGFDERRKAEFLSNLYKTEHYEIVMKAGDMERVMPKLIWHLEDLRVGQSYPNYYVARLASKFVKVVLSGTGGDELFAGYPWRYYRAAVNNNTDDYEEKYYNYWQRLIDDRVKSQFFQPGIYPDIAAHNIKDVFKSVIKINRIEKSPEEYLNRSLYFEIKTFLHGLLLVEDKLSSAHSLETRVPFLDNDILDFGMKVPVKYKLRDLKKIVKINENLSAKREKYFAKTNDGKIILRKVLNKYVPKPYSSGIKQGFSAPDASWFKGESIDYIKNLFYNKKAKIYDYIQPKTAKMLMNEHFSGHKNRRLLIWSLLSFEWWLKTFEK